MIRPLIAVTLGRRNQPAAINEIQTVVTGCDIQYVESLVRAGGAPMLAPCVAHPDVLASIAERMDGLLLTGGGDVSALLYGEEPHRLNGLQDPVRDEMEISLARHALERGIPILGVCRGIQVLNVALGGTLVQDIPAEYPEACQHYAHPIARMHIHTVQVESGSLLAGLFGTESLPVNSYHHQAVKDLGQGLRVNCRAKDGVIEGVESAHGAPILAVQFHPEELAATDPRFQSLFDWLVRAASEQQGR